MANLTLGGLSHDEFLASLPDMPAPKRGGLRGLMSRTPPCRGNGLVMVLAAEPEGLAPELHEPPAK